MFATTIQNFKFAKISSLGKKKKATYPGHNISVRIPVVKIPNQGCWLQNAFNGHAL